MPRPAPVFMATRDLADHLVQATEAAAVAASKWRGLGDGKAADGAAVEAMRAVFDNVPFEAKGSVRMHRCCGLESRWDRCKDSPEHLA